MGLWLGIGLALAAGLVAALGWSWPLLKAQLGALRTRERLRALASSEPGLTWLEPDARGGLDGLDPTLISIFGPYSGVAVALALDAEGGAPPAYLLEVRFGHRASPWTWAHGALVLAARLPHPVPMLTLRRAKGEAQSRTTDFKAGSHPLVVQAIDGWLELWSTKADRKRARALVGKPLVDALESDPGWDVRTADRWLVLFERDAPRSPRLDDLRSFLRRAGRLRDAFSS